MFGTIMKWPFKGSAANLSKLYKNNLLVYLSIKSSSRVRLKVISNFHFFQKGNTWKISLEGGCSIAGLAEVRLGRRDQAPDDALRLIIGGDCDSW